MLNTNVVLSRLSLLGFILLFFFLITSSLFAQTSNKTVQKNATPPFTPGYSSHYDQYAGTNIPLSATMPQRKQNNPYENGVNPQTPANLAPGEQKNTLSGTPPSTPDAKPLSTSAAPAMIPVTPSNDTENQKSQATGLTSEYSLKSGQLTASKQPFDPNDYTARSLSWPMGTIVKVTNLVNNTSTVVQINDKPKTLNHHLLDLSPAAAKDLDISTGKIVPVTVSVIRIAPLNIPKPIKASPVPKKATNQNTIDLSSLVGAPTQNKRPTQQASPPSVKSSAIRTPSTYEAPESSHYSSIRGQSPSSSAPIPPVSINKPQPKKSIHVHVLPIHTMKLQVVTYKDYKNVNSTLSLLLYFGYKPKVKFEPKTGLYRIYLDEVNPLEFQKWKLKLLKLGFSGCYLRSSIPGVLVTYR